jgi:hypothetical protein
MEEIDTSLQLPFKENFEYGVDEFIKIKPNNIALLMKKWQYFSLDLSFHFYIKIYIKIYSKS